MRQQAHTRRGQEISVFPSKGTLFNNYMFFCALLQGANFKFVKPLEPAAPGTRNSLCNPQPLELATAPGTRNQEF
jgi:hypothetical protein